MADILAGNINGINVYASKILVDRVQKRKHRQVRINKKWLKRYGYTETPSKQCYMTPFGMIAHPAIIEKMKKAMEVKNDN